MNRRKFLKYSKLLNYYPPFFGAGIKLKKVFDGGRGYLVEMKLRWYNRNVYGTHYGGSLYSMCDPFFVFSAYSYFGDDYILWDKSASIKFISPGKSRVWAKFEIPLDTLEKMKSEVDHMGKMTYKFETEVKDDNDNIIAKVEKEIYIRKK